MTVGEMSFESVPLRTRQITRQSKIGSDVFEITLECRTGTLADITALAAHQGHLTKTTLLSGKTSVQTTGTKGTLVIDGVSYTKCAIESLQYEEIYGTQLGRWKYTVSFVQETV